jgi:Rps23 Pro-64 3,4-dihydroxylase Tpa1-like proline 4-hydroxylase
MITPIKTNHPLVYRFDNVLPVEDCLSLEQYLKYKVHYNPKIDLNLQPWHENQNLNYINIVEGTDIKKIINSCRFLINQLIFFSYKQLCFPTYTDLVLWQKGRKMDFHNDNGNNEIPEIYHRHFSSVLYINDEYKGGETVIKGSPNYISTPKKGSVIIFKSDDSCRHKVNEVLEGNRITLSTWFTTNRNCIED